MENTVRVNSIDLHYYDSAPDETGRKTVALIHGLGGCWQAWEFQLAYLEGLGLRVIAVDLRGHAGSSKPPGANTVELMADDVARLIERLGVGPCFVVGHSLGGMVSYQLAATRHELVKRLVIINSFSRIPKVKPKAIFKLLYRTSIIYGLGLQTWGRVLARELLPHRDQDALRRRLVELSKLNDDRSAYMNNMKAAVKVDLRQRLGMIKCPVLIMAAQRDYTPVAEKIADAERINRYRNRTTDDLARVVEISASRHLSPWDQPAFVNEQIGEFIRGEE